MEPLSIAVLIVLFILVIIPYFLVGSGLTLFSISAISTGTKMGFGLLDSIWAVFGVVVFATACLVTSYTVTKMSFTCMPWEKRNQ